MMDGFAKKEISLRYWLLGRDFHKAVEAMEMGRKYHRGLRKDGAPEFSHQVAIAQFVRTIIGDLQFPEETLATIFLHDIREDHGISDDEIRSMFGDRVANSVGYLTKEFRGHKRDPFEVFELIGKDPIASIVKGADRIHNFSTMLGAFTEEKQKEYLKEAEFHFMPMLKRARRTFPKQEPAYENLKWALNSQMCLIRAIHDARTAS